MLKSCRKCGKIHDDTFKCSGYKKSTNKITIADKFRGTQVWKRKRKEILKRDKCLCQLCIRKMYDTIGDQFNGIRLQVHHIEPVQEDYNKRLDNENLISLCSYHHRMAEKGKIPKPLLIDIAKQQECE
ncbi:HNH endonuclease [Clostridium butyricum]|uniref:HNH endonuclease n=1 Tax=Clostridium butyricum TaxID=1492 RepID=UPI002ABDBC0F|nr:HNH endonuclease [Clostridium butyricum]